jgi:hypothetical protein
MQHIFTALMTIIIYITNYYIHFIRFAMLRYLLSTSVNTYTEAAEITPMVRLPPYPPRAVTFFLQRNSPRSSPIT